MADDASTAAPVDALAATTTLPDTNEPVTAAETTEPASANDETLAEDESSAAAVDAAATSTPEPAKENGESAAEASVAADSIDVDSAPASNSKDKKRKSVGGVPEHKSKKLNKKKSMPNLHLDCKPGEYYWARLKGYPPWPAIICDESMLPEALLGSRPVSTTRPDGSIRADFEEGGKNAKERTFPIMFLETNEFQWMVNTSLTPLDPAECEKPTNAKMSKALKAAHELAAKGHGIDHFKGVLKVWQDEEETFAKEKAEMEAENARLEEEAKAKEAEDGAKGEEKPKKKAARKSKAADDDTEMEDAEAPKSSKKRKKDADSDAEGPKQKKTPKITKLNAPKTPNGEGSASTKKSTAKPKRKVVSAPKEDEDEAKPQMSETERLAQREKAILYLRHRLQKGFLSRDQAPQETEMNTMAEFFTQLEAYQNLEPSIIRTTKIHKVLKAIIKLASVPKDEDYQFKKRSSAMLEEWNKRMEAEGEGSAGAADPKPTTEPETNGEHATAAEPDVKPLDSDKALEQKDTEMKDAEETKEGAEAEKNVEEIDEKIEKDEVAGAAEPAEKTVQPKNEAQDEADGDVSMQTAPEEATA